MEVTQREPPRQLTGTVTTALIWSTLTVRLIALAPEGMRAMQHLLFGGALPHVVSGLLLIVGSLPLLIPAYVLLRPTDASPRLTGYDIIATVTASAAFAVLTDAAAWRLGFLVIAGTPLWIAMARSVPTKDSEPAGHTSAIEVLLALAAATHILVMGLVILVYVLFIPAIGDSWTLLRLIPFGVVALIAMLAPTFLLVLSAKRRVSRLIAANLLFDLIVVTPTLIAWLWVVGPMLLVSIPLRVTAAFADRRV